MKLSSFLALAAIIAAVFGVAFLVAPSQLVALYGVRLTPATVVVGRIAGAAILALALVFWGCRNESGTEISKAVLLAGFIGNGLDCLILLQATRTGLLNWLGWPQAVIGGLLALGFAYYAFGGAVRTSQAGRI
jgi:hypothetical protein